MTGRRLYDLLCDGWIEQTNWSREHGNLLPAQLLAWPFLTAAERSALNKAAARIKGIKR